MQDARLGWLAIGAAIFAGLVVAVLRLSPGARLRRRLRKTHARVVSKSERPTVKFSVKPPKE